ncbi:hypothetical protein GR140_30520 (plasmid) [Pseudomonas putida]|uniref:hypothetical protein n=1 Tax=Pseudomonas putida TaxID=303 RepID=UPI001BAEF3A5|nr:hypothetical protein [Pseudomonas putida]QUG93103.1 hypothetical protein GR140_30520 [Pseudomonas putida]
MNTFSRRVFDNIVPLSIAEKLPEAFAEWSFTDQVRDHEAPTADCQLCDQEHVRYHYQIRNGFTGNTLWVGSQCILRFNLSVFESGRRLSPDQARKKLNNLEQVMRFEACIRALERLAEAEDNDILAKALAYYRKNQYLTPKFAFVVLWRLDRHQIDHSPSFFKINLKLARNQDALRAMPLTHVHMIWPALSSAQREIAKRLGHREPDRPAASGG